MPELPEVEIVRQSLNRQVKNCKIINIQVNNRNLRLKVPKNFEQIFKNSVIEKIQRKSKYLILVFDNHLYCVIHLGMSGTLHFIGLKKKTTFETLVPAHKMRKYYQTNVLTISVKQHQQLDFW